MPGYHSGINILGAGVEVTKVTLCASFCWKSMSRPSLYNLDSTPPQVINAAANDGEPCSGGQSPTSHDFAPIHLGLPELSAPFRNRPFPTPPKKREPPPIFQVPPGATGRTLDGGAFARRSLGLAGRIPPFLWHEAGRAGRLKSQPRAGLVLIAGWNVPSPDDCMERVR